MKKLIFLFTLSLLMIGMAWGQQIIGAYPSMDGGFEAQSGTLVTASSISSAQEFWTTQIASTGVIQNTGGRSGPKYIQYSQSGTKHKRLQSPTAAVSTGSHVVQFYYQGDMDGTIGGDIRGAVSAVGTSSPSYGGYHTDRNTGATWTKYTAVVNPTGTPANGIGIISTNETGLFYIDDFVVYPGSAVDETAPNSPGTASVTDPSNISLSISWGAASGGVDGGGYLLVRYTSDPGVGDNPNQNGIYAVGNSIGVNGVVRYIGTDTTFTDSEGLDPGTQYWYKIYTGDKAFNYSPATSTSGTTTSGANTPPSISNISINPSTGITSSTDVTVSATITDAEGTVEAAEVRWGTTSENRTNIVTMSNTSGDTWEGTIPAQENNTTVYYSVYAMDDEADDVETAEYSYTVSDPVPLITVNPSTLSGFTYVVDEGPSTHQTFTVSGSTLTADITVTASTNYEISEDGTTYTSPITLTETDGSVAETIIYVRLKAGRAVGAYNNEDITITSTGADSKTVTCSGSVTTPPPSLTEIIVPQFMQGFNGTNNNKRLPNAFRFKIDNLIPSATYRYYGMFVLSTDGASVDGAGIGWFVNADNTISRSTTLAFTTAGMFSEFTADATGSYTGWFMGEGSGNDRFTPGNDVYFRIMLNNGADGSSVANRLTTSSSIRVINFGTEANVDQGTFLRGISQAPAKNFLFVYDNEAGTGRPISGTIIENDDLDLSGVNQILALYKNHVDGVNGAWGVIIPNSVGSKSFTGIKRIESRNLIDGSLYAEATDSDGVWPSGVDTKNPTGGDTDMGHLVMGESDATLPVELSTFTVALNNYNSAVLTWVTQTETNVQGFYIYRNMANDLSSALQLSGMIPATNTSQQQVYQFTDKELNQTGTYYYWLMVADMDGSEGFHGPISLNYEQGGLQLPEIPKFTELKNVYPNPFNPSTTISYALANSQNVNFNIFNNRGQMVRSMELGNKAAGNHSFVWDGCDNYGRSVSTGVYFIRMQAGSESFSKKAVLMK